MAAQSKAKTASLSDPSIVGRAVLDSFRKLSPRVMAKNPVMFVVEIGAVITAAELAHDLWNRSPGIGPATGSGFGLQISLWLWFTVLFANFAEAMAEGRGKAQADTLRKARSETTAHVIRANGAIEEVSSSQLRLNDIVVVAVGEPAQVPLPLGRVSILARSAVSGRTYRHPRRRVKFLPGLSTGCDARRRDLSGVYTQKDGKARVRSYGNVQRG